MLFKFVFLLFLQRNNCEKLFNVLGRYRGQDSNLSKIREENRFKFDINEVHFYFQEIS